MQSQLAQAQKLESIGLLAAGIAHEINTPIQYIGDNMLFLQESFQDLSTLLEHYAALYQVCRDGAPITSVLGHIETTAAAIDVAYLAAEIPTAIQQSLEGVERVATIVRAMKEFSHPGTKEKVSVDLNKAIESTITVARNEWKYVAQMATDLAPDLPLVPCVPGAPNQVLLNILVNAAHALGDIVGDGTPEKGTITVSTRQVGDGVEIRIADTGPGIPMERFPLTVRIILSGYADSSMILKAVGPVHQYLAKPCDAVTLQVTVARACALRSLLADPT